MTGFAWGLLLTAVTWFNCDGLTTLHTLGGFLLSWFHHTQLNSLAATLLGMPGAKPGKKVIRSFLLHLVTVCTCLIVIMHFSLLHGLAFFTGYSSFILAAILLPFYFLFPKVSRSKAPQEKMRSQERSHNGDRNT